MQYQHWYQTAPSCEPYAHSCHHVPGNYAVSFSYKSPFLGVVCTAKSFEQKRA
jgi:hypothetical protein